MHKRRDDIQEHLSKIDVQQRIIKAISNARSQATVTIAQAAELFRFSENQLRDWEQRDLLTPERPKHDKGIKGRRLYSASEFTKLAIIQELLNADYNPGEITPVVYELWTEILSKLPADYAQDASQYQLSPLLGTELSSGPMDDFVDGVYEQQLFFRYISARLAYVALMLIGEEMPLIKVALILPYNEPPVDLLIPRNKPTSLQLLGESLVGWLGNTRTFYMRMMKAPTFAYASDYRVEPLRETTKLEIQQEERYWSRTWILLQREAPKLFFSKEMVETLQRLLQPLYDRAYQWKDFWGYGERYSIDPAINFSSSAKSTDAILTGLANMIVESGGKNEQGQSRWRFCCILLPKDIHVSLPQQSLVVRAGSTHSPHKPHLVMISPEGTSIALSLRAFQSGHIAYRHNISVEDLTIELRQEEGDIRSAIALPAGAQDSNPVAVLYIASDQPDSFSESDQRLLQLYCRIIEEFVRSYFARNQSYANMSAVIADPGVVDVAFKKFWSEEDFISDTEKLLSDIQNALDEREAHEALETSSTGKPEEALSFIGIDIDDQSTIANRYGDRLARNLSLEMGQRVRRHLLPIFRRSEAWQLYHIYGDRFYLMLQGVAMERARVEAEKLREGLKGSYKVEAKRTTTDAVPLPDSLVEVQNVTVRLAVTSYPHDKLYDMLQQMKLKDVTANILRSLDAGLKRGKDDETTHGNVVYSWDSERLDFIRVSPS